MEKGEENIEEQGDKLEKIRKKAEKDLRKYQKQAAHKEKEL
jgi:hypothetical protein